MLALLSLALGWHDSEPIVSERITASVLKGVGTGAYGNSGVGHMYQPGANDICSRNPSGCAIPAAGNDICVERPILCSGQMTNAANADGLAKKRLVGTLPTEIGLSTDFDGYIDLRGNSISGTIPTQIGKLRKLKGLFLNINSFSGTIPTELGNLLSAEGIKLHRNHLSGTVPSEFGRLDGLLCQTACGWRSGLDLHWNHLTGTIPAAMSHFSHVACSLVSYEQFGTNECPTPRTAFTNTTVGQRGTVFG